MQCYYDFHIHSCLSPCGDMDMTPNNIVNMALLKGLDAIAITDHNCAANAEAVLRAAQGRLTVLPGMEVESCEEVHMVCLFAELSQCRELERDVQESLLRIQNDPEIYGEQVILDELDEPCGSVEQLLVVATSLSVYDIVKRTHALGGVCIAAHIDKSAYSILSNLGALPDDLAVDAIELSKYGDFNALAAIHGNLRGMRVLHSSDAHYLADISERVHSFEIMGECNANAVINALRGGIK